MFIRLNIKLLSETKNTEHTKIAENLYSKQIDKGGRQTSPIAGKFSTILHICSYNAPYTLLNKL